jgi:hypothetical protein
MPPTPRRNAVTPERLEDLTRFMDALHGRASWRSTASFAIAPAWRMRSTAFGRLTKEDRADALLRLAQAGRPIGVLADRDADPSVGCSVAAPERR